MTQTTIPKPQTPWGTSIAQRLATLAILALAAVLAGAAVEFTGLSGKLGFAASYFFFASLLIFVQQLRLRDLAAAKDSLLSSFAFLAMTLTLIPIVSIVSTVFLKGYKGIHFGMFTNDMTMASVNDPVTSGGLIHALIGTLIMVGGALIVSFPIGLLTALYLTEIKGNLARPIKFLVQAMSGVPSIVAGLFVFTVLVTGRGFSAISGAVALSILMLPTVARTAEEVLKLIPEDLRTSAYALGATQTATTFRIVLPAARAGLVTASMLGVARVGGETAPLIMTSFYLANFSTDTSGHPLASLPMYIYQNFTNGTDLALSRAWGGAAVLLSLIFIIFTIARLASGRAKG